ncbi:PREDICTED: protein CHROMATIN REMODELING 35-like [Camelina sativa]|uniref:Protein CHROMATIN REMODELING 35-like n=1 Tax=Camelina sativa TaxID=90675 RepID=A0ABM1QFW0_CAMSA|nr:PREDICTED: protein CHROMATIN REMODELING 35-like [Camelina sativa]
MILDNQEAGGSSGDGLVDVPVMYLTSEKDIHKNHTIGSSFKHLMIGGSSIGGNSGKGLDKDIFSDGNELVKINTSKDKGKAICDLNETVWRQDEPVSNTFETSGEILKNCEHSWIWKQGSGHVCWYNQDHSLPPGFGSNNSKDISLRVPKDGFLGTGIFPHPVHRSSMNSHHIEILNFLCKNLGVQNSNGCILAQAPISEKTFLMINFIYGYIKKHPNSKPLIVLPKRMINRAQQLEILKQWAFNKSIIFLGAKQFSNIVADNNGIEAAYLCRDLLINIPSLVIFDRGTDPRNEMMRFLKFVALIKTPNKILLTGTLYQNSMKEVFNILDVAFPEFLKHNKAGEKIRRFLNVDSNTDGLPMDLKMPLFDQLEDALLRQDSDHGDKIGYLTELKMLTNKVIYNHQGQFLLEVPRLMDFTVVLKPTSSQKSAWDIEKNSKGKGFKTYSTLSGITLHPVLCTFSDRVKGLPAPNEDEMDEIVKSIDVADGVKTKFFMGLVKLCEYTNEKILVVSQYVNPLIFLQRLVAKIKGWKDGKETFMIKGDTSLSVREVSVNQFNNSHDARIFFASIKACNEHITLTGATRVLMLDIIAKPCMARQAIELAYHPGQQKEVYSYRLVAVDTSEEDEDIMAARKEIISGIWFDGKTYPIDGRFCFPSIDGNYSTDHFLGSSYMREDIKTIYKR